MTKVFTTGTFDILHYGHINLLNKAKESLISARNEAINGQVIDIIAIDLQSAYKCILEILGKSSKEDLLDSIFSKFCLGK